MLECSVCHSKIFLCDICQRDFSEFGQVYCYGGGHYCSYECVKNASGLSLEEAQTDTTVATAENTKDDY
jgi:hypothetical protein